MTTDQKATITAGNDGRYAVSIGASTRDGFALVWRGNGHLQFRRTAGGPPENVSVTDQDEAGKPLPPSFQAQVLALTHPDLWVAPENTEAAAPVGGEDGQPVAAEPDAPAIPDPAAEPADTTTGRARRR